MTEAKTNACGNKEMSSVYQSYMIQMTLLNLTEKYLSIALIATKIQHYIRGVEGSLIAPVTHVNLIGFAFISKVHQNNLVILAQRRIC